MLLRLTLNSLTTWLSLTLAASIPECWDYRRVIMQVYVVLGTEPRSWSTRQALHQTMLLAQFWTLTWKYLTHLCLALKLL